MRLISAFCSRVSVRHATRALQTRQGCASHSEAATGTIVTCTHGPMDRFAPLVRPATGRLLQGEERTR